MSVGISILRDHHPCSFEQRGLRFTDRIVRPDMTCFFSSNRHAIDAAPRAALLFNEANGALPVWVSPMIRRVRDTEPYSANGLVPLALQRIELIIPRPIN